MPKQVKVLVENLTGDGPFVFVKAALPEGVDWYKPDEGPISPPESFQQAITLCLHTDQQMQSCEGVIDFALESNRQENGADENDATKDDEGTRHLSFLRIAFSSPVHAQIGGFNLMGSSPKFGAWLTEDEMKGELSNYDEVPPIPDAVGDMADLAAMSVDISQLCNVFGLHHHSVAAFTTKWYCNQRS
eukprot:gnl/MRDRNA2_/MRDRNA2_40935_c0_seq1.p1 gnl/MRDRNA2_/MRDRNA2_40935_c0~~gnl/MRDRNA2_/MRDRNA2_40935_c0_seq1.p1  ORF type:complete len:188 (+),score=42.36 gnl/MRDRNA2_/MRDRNA2_40935_c0_seq1:107-670(+)